MQISDIVVGQEPNVTAREALLRWARRSTARYPGVRVTDFTCSWRDGLAFSALLHRNRPDLVDWRTARSSQPRERLDRVFYVAEREYGVTRLLDPEGNDRLSIRSSVPCRNALAVCETGLTSIGYWPIEELHFIVNSTWENIECVTIFVRSRDFRFFFFIRWNLFHDTILFFCFFSLLCASARRCSSRGLLPQIRIAAVRVLSGHGIWPESLPVSVRAP